MPSNPVVFIDTSVFVHLLKVEGRSDQHEEMVAEFDRLRSQGARFVLPITTIIETGNMIFYSDRSAAQRLVAAVEAAKDDNPPWTIRAVNWDRRFLEALIAGDSTGSPLVDLISDKRMATGDVAILVERDEFRAQTAFSDVRVWSLDAQLAAQS